MSLNIRESRRRDVKKYLPIKLLSLPDGSVFQFVVEIKER